MEILTPDTIKQIIDEINESAETTRRAKHKRRHDIYKDDGKKFVIEQIQREFGQDALAEMRVCSLNILKKIVNKRSAVYKTPPVRKAESPASQALVDYYVDELDLNTAMQKANRYFNLFSNCALYCVPHEGELKLYIVPPYLYSVVPNGMNPTEADVWVFNSFTEGSALTPNYDVPSATGAAGWQREPGQKLAGDKVDSQEKTDGMRRNYIFWTPMQHFTSDESGSRLMLEGVPPEQQFANPIEICPVVNLAKERDAEFWASQGQDLVDDSINFSMGWSDSLTISKHQAFGILTIISDEEPKKLTVGVNRAVWLKSKPEGPQPSIQYVQSNSQIAESMGMLGNYLGLILSTNDMNPGAISGNDKPQNAVSGFSLLIQMSDALEAIESDKPYLKAAESELWEVIAKWHNWLFDTNNLEDEAKAFGKFPETFDVEVTYRDIKPIESEQERITAVKSLMDMGLLTKMDALKKLNPDLTDEQAVQKLTEVETENQGRMERAIATMTPAQPQGETDGQSESEV